MTLNIRTVGADHRHPNSVPLSHNHRVFRLTITPLGQGMSPPRFRARLRWESGPDFKPESNSDEANRWEHELCTALIQAGVAKDIVTSLFDLGETALEFTYIGDDDPAQLGVQRATRKYLVGQMGHVTIG